MILLMPDSWDAICISNLYQLRKDVCVSFPDDGEAPVRLIRKCAPVHDGRRGWLRLGVFAVLPRDSSDPSGDVGPTDSGG